MPFRRMSDERAGKQGIKAAFSAANSTHTGKSRLGVFLFTGLGYSLSLSSTHSHTREKHTHCGRLVGRLAHLCSRTFSSSPSTFLSFSLSGESSKRVRCHDGGSKRRWSLCQLWLHANQTRSSPAYSSFSLRSWVSES